MDEPAIFGRCESCGQRAHVRLDDGSLWCTGCDLAARDLGYSDGAG